ncbi:I78 family peptidase inhibitor [Gymnodinialimonas sp.]
MTRFPLIAALIALPVMTMAQSDDPDTCGAAGFQGLVGQSAEIAAMLVLDQPKRVITPGSIVTRDHRLERINFDVDNDNVITSIYCG